MESIREQLENLDTAALENFIRIQSEQSNVDAFMARAFTMSAQAMERHLERMQVAQALLDERYAQVAALVNEADAQTQADELARWERMNQVDEIVDYEISQLEELPENDGGNDGEEF